MITVSRRDIRHVRAVLRRAGLHRSGVSGPPQVRITAGVHGVRFLAHSPDLVAQYTLVRPHSEDVLSVPVEVLDACEGKSDDLVTFSSNARHEIEIQWSDRGIPQMLVEPQPAERDTSEPPQVPGDAGANPPHLWQALADVRATCSSDPSRFALDAIQFRGQSGEAVATDGRQVLVQRGFEFPFVEELLIQSSPLLGCKELRPEQVFLLGRIEGWVYLSVAGWRFWFREERERRFPSVQAVFRDHESATSRLHLSDSDAQFLADALPRLPADESFNRPITVELNGRVAVRAQGPAGPVTEVVLAASSYEGDPVTFVADRRFLGRALQLGFRDLHLFGSDNPMQCRDGDRQYVFALLGSTCAVKPAEDAVRIESPGDASAPNSKRRSRQHKRAVEVPTGVEAAMNHPHGDSSSTISLPIDSSPSKRSNSARRRQWQELTVGAAQPSQLEEAAALRDALYESYQRARDLVRDMPKSRSHSSRARRPKRAAEGRAA